MNFQLVKPVQTADQYLDAAFRKAREARVKKEGRLENLVFEKKREMLKLDIARNYLADMLNRILEDFPSFNHLPLFYNELVKLTLDYSSLKKSLGAVHWAIGKISTMHKSYISQMAKCEDIKRFRPLREGFYGRISSVIKQIKAELLYLEKCRHVMKNFPDIKEMPTVCIFGFPNVGKSTLLGKLTPSKPEIAAYAFTTKTLNVGYFISKEKGQETKVQLIDTPGTLNRMEKMNNIELQAFLAVKHLANALIYIFDLTEPYPLKDQEELYHRIKKETDKPIYIYLSKADVLDEEKIESFQHKYPTLDLEEVKRLLSHI
ncbi:50S ribosome-binding GTPase [Candidatus Woesearchaeota archaeon]|nr:50S ribosome-binding GTPase [Candidatus Woesearchaeota archaeon]